MKRWPIILTLFCLFLLLIFIFNLWLKKEEQKLFTGKPAPLQEKEMQKQQPIVKPLETERRAQAPEEKIIMPPEEPYERGLGLKSLEEEAKEAEELGIKPKDEELEDLKKKGTLIIY